MRNLYKLVTVAMLLVFGTTNKLSLLAVQLVLLINATGICTVFLLTFLLKWIVRFKKKKEASISEKVVTIIANFALQHVIV